MITISKRSHHLICSPRSGINYASVGFTGQIVNVKDRNILLLGVQKKNNNIQMIYCKVQLCDMIGMGPMVI